jgi:phenylacetate-coenzyme A ligase PaaK-like adenylate-forming protein
MSPVDERTAREIGGVPLEKWQLWKTRELTARLRASSPFYANLLAGTNDGDLRSLSDVARLPFTCPEDVASAPEAFLCAPARDVARVATAETSGSTGRPKRIFFTERDMERTVDFFSAGMAEIAPEGRVAVMYSSPAPGSLAD